MAPNIKDECKPGTGSPMPGCDRRSLSSEVVSIVLRLNQAAQNTNNPIAQEGYRGAIASLSKVLQQLQ